MEYRVRALNKTGSINAKHNSRIKPRQTSKVSRQRQAWNMTGTRNTWEKISMQKIRVKKIQRPLLPWNAGTTVVVWWFFVISFAHQNIMWTSGSSGSVYCLLCAFWVFWWEGRGSMPGGLGVKRKWGGALDRTPGVSLSPSWLAQLALEKGTCFRRTLGTLLSLILFDFVGFSKLPFLLRSSPVCSFC